MKAQLHIRPAMLQRINRLVREGFSFEGRMELGLSNHNSKPKRHMPGIHSIDKVCISAWIDRELHRAFSKLAKARKESISDALVGVLQKATKHVELNADDYAQIAADMRAKEARQDRRRKAQSRNESGASGEAQ